MAESEAKSSNDDRAVFLVSYPKIILLYPTFFAALASALLLQFMPHETQFSRDNATVNTINWVFFWIFATNLVVLSFDFPRTTWLTLFFLLTAAIFGVILMATHYPTLLPNVMRVINMIKPRADATFYWCFSVVLGIIYVCVFIGVRFDYWEVRSNELLHHHGFLSSLERFPAPNLRITKEIDDVFEYMLLGSGRLVLHPSSERRAFELDHVPFVSSKEARITKLLGALQVNIREEKPS